MRTPARLKKQPIRVLRPNNDVTPTPQMARALNGIHVVKEKEGWLVFKFGEDALRKHFDNRKKALLAARQARGQSKIYLFVHDQNGAVRAIAPKG